MPTYGDEKARDMVRSILPSTARKGAREDLNQYRRTERKRSNMRLERYRNLAASDAIELYDDESEPLDEWRSIPRAFGWDDPVWERRAHDKVAHFVRWAKAVTADVPDGERIQHLRSIVPNNKIGRHAISHCYGLDTDDGFYRWWHYRRYTAEERAWIEAASYAQAEKDLIWVIESGNHKRFNQIIKEGNYPFYPLGYRRDDAITPEPERNRLLLNGIGDIERFISKCPRSAYYSSWMLTDIIDRLKRERGIV